LLLCGVLLCVVGGCVVPCVGFGFGVAPGSFRVVSGSDVAGAHADLTTSFGFVEDGAGGVGALLRDAEVVLPVGFAGYPPDVKTCDPVQLEFEECPADSQIGVLEFVLREIPGFDDTYRYPVYNMVPPPGETAVFGVVVHKLLSANIVLSVGADYRVRASVTNVISGYELLRQSLTVWGVPAEQVHDAERGNEYHCLKFGEHASLSCVGGGVVADENAVPFLVNPTECTSGPLTAELVGVTSWEGEEAKSVSTDVGPFVGCEALKFAPTIGVAPEETQATLPSGYEIVLRVPQTEGAEGLGSADLRDSVIRMPSGVVLSPSAATGLEACTEAEIGLESSAPVGCPAGSKVGVVSLVTPALTGELKGFLYLGGPVSGAITGPPFTVYLTLAGHGVLIKIKGQVVPNPVTGQLVTTFDRNPELPFSELRVQLNGGSRATVANPSVCGSYSAESVLTPWSSPFEGDAEPGSPPFEITGCGGPRFAPSFVGGTTSNQAGGFSPLSVTFSREDAEEDLGGITVTTPPGLSGSLAHIPLCEEPQAAAGTCSEASRIGEVTAGAGPGPEPFFIKGGKVFLTGPYAGAPFGLSIDIPEKAGPFDFGSGACDCEVVRASVSVDPHTAQLTVIDRSLPTMKDGIPFQVKKVNVLVNRPEFVFNPTSCEPMSVQGSLSSTQGATSVASSHFQATNCAALAFEPGFKVSTSGKTSRLDGASLDTRLSYPSKPQGSEANIARVKVELPKRLPSRLTTLQKACPAAVFEANPASCPAASTVGIAKAVTPILPVPLTGPAIFVSHGGEAFPSLIMVLQGYGVTVDLVGTTFISKAGITSSTFKTVPDVPVGTFELYLPEGRNSALAANGDLCTGKQLVMPTEFVAQDGAVIDQSTKLTVTGCTKTKKKTTKKIAKRKTAKKSAVKAARKSASDAAMRRGA
jgi:hypothetical protein